MRIFMFINGGNEEKEEDPSPLSMPYHRPIDRRSDDVHVFEQVGDGWDNVSVVMACCRPCNAWCDWMCYCLFLCFLCDHGTIPCLLYAFSIKLR